MSPRQKVRDKLQPLCVSIENKLERRKDGQRAQQFRQLQHRIFGLSDQEWINLKDYFDQYNKVGVISQGEAFLAKQHWRMQFTLLAAPTEIRDTMQNELLAYTENVYQMKEAKAASIKELENLATIRKKLEHTPVARALGRHQAKKKWHLSDWAVSQCAQSGGCCAHQCGCCLKSRYYEYNETWRGHCTEACSCCLERLGVGRVELESSRGVRFQPRPKRNDTASRMMMRAYVWGSRRKIQN
ncbi:hypothetical protein BJX99DRAFT_125611 [Aspergillus californicus]